MPIRKAVLKDAAAITSIAKNLFLAIPGFDWHMEKTITHQIRKRKYFVFERRGTIVAIMNLSTVPDAVELVTLAVASGHRGSGVGTELIAFAKQFTRRKRRSELVVGSFYKYGVKDFYVRAGFSREGYGVFNRHKYHIFSMHV